MQGMADFSPFEGKILRGWPVAIVKGPGSRGAAARSSHRRPAVTSRRVSVTSADDQAASGRS
jgi:hypothetical protein